MVICPQYPAVYSHTLKYRCSIVSQKVIESLKMAFVDIVELFTISERALAIYCRVYDKVVTQVMEIKFSQ